MERKADTTESLTRQAIDECLAALRAREKALIERDRELFLNGGLSDSMTAPERAALKLVRQQLEAAGLPVPEKQEPRTLVEVQEALADVRADIARYSDEDLRLRAVETAAKAVKINPEWRALAKEWLLAAEKFGAIEARCAAFRQRAGEDVAAILAGAYLPIGTGAEIEVYRPAGWWGGAMTVDDVTKTAIEEGLVGRGDVDRARKEGR